MTGTPASRSAPLPGSSAKGAEQQGSEPALADVTPLPRGAVPLPGTDPAATSAPVETASIEIESSDRTPKRDLWQRIRDGFAMPDLPTPLVEQKKRFYLQRPDYLKRMFERGSRYLHFIVEEVERRGMPTEIALLPFVESAMNPVALSSAKAAGLWQFIPATGKRYDLEQNWWEDNRRDVVESTEAALQYLQTIYAMHGNDWFLALASYNWGEGAVGRAVRANRARGKPTGYLHLKMPNETRHYVPKLIAMKEIVLNAAALGVDLPPLPDEPYFVLVKKTRPIDLTLAARFASMTVEEFVALNPAHNRPVIAATENNMLKIPADRLEGFVAAIARHEADQKVFATWQPYTLKPGESLEDIARRGGVTAAELRRANSISPDVTILAGTRLLAPQKSVTDESKIASFNGARIYQQVHVPASYHVVKRHDTAPSIARRYGLTVSQLVAFNGGRKQIKPGQRLIVRNPQVQTVLINEQGTRQLIRSQSTSPRSAAPSEAQGG
ncbi:MAG: transglycosylase SLT domain-containing protein [Burkholderiaceae bacterium]